MSAVQPLFKTILPPRWGDSMEAESRCWVFRCKYCGQETSIWDIGGIRWKAAGNPARLVPCPNRGQSSLARLMYQADA